MPNGYLSICNSRWPKNKRMNPKFTYLLFRHFSFQCFRFLSVLSLLMVGRVGWGQSVTPSNNPYVVPTCVTSIKIELWGGGGGGGVGGNGGGGGGGAYFTTTIAVTSGQSFNWAIGNGGEGQTTTSQSSNGGTTTFGLYSAVGGIRAIGQNQGGNGNPGARNSGGVGGSGGGPGGGAGGTPAQNSPGGNGEMPGGGGAGGGGNNDAGGNGGAGDIKVTEFFGSPPSISSQGALNFFTDPGVCTYNIGVGIGVNGHLSYYLHC